MAVRDGNPIAQREWQESQAIGLPPDHYDLWGWFRRLQGSSNSAMGPAPIHETEIQAFFKNRQIIPETWQVDALVYLDRLSRSKEKDE